VALALKTMSTAHAVALNSVSMNSSGPVFGESPVHRVDGEPESSLNASEVVRLMAHELRQPLSTIESIAYYLNLVLPREDGRTREQLSRLQGLIEQSNWILSNGVRCVELSPAARELVDLEEIVSDALAHRPADIAVDAEFAGSLPQVLLDPGQGRDLVEGLLSLLSKGAGDAPPIHVSTRHEGGRILLEIASPGRTPSQSAGASLSLESARRSVHANGGTLEYLTNANGAKVSISFPVFGNDA